MLTVESLSFAFAHRPLFSELSFAVPPGRVLHLQGSNGVGKSTLLSILAGLRRASGGTVAFQGVAPLRAYEYLAAEANGLYLKMDALTNLRYWCRVRGLNFADEQLSAALATWGLGHPLLRQGLAVGHFSTGLRRRLGLARVVLGQAACWLLDEPANGLDEKGLTLFRSALATHTAAGGYAVVISHDLSLFEGLAVDRFPLVPRASLFSCSLSS